MWSEVLKIIPRIESGELRKMENDLSKRFLNVAKKFGGGLKNALLGGGILALAGGLLNKLLNPLKDVQETIEKTLKRANDLSTDAKEFGTTEGKLFKLQTIGKSFGVDETLMNTLLTKFQTALVAARQPNATPNAVSAFAGEKDVADAFFKFANSMKNAPKDTQVMAQQEVFGERLSGRARELFQGDLVERSTRLGLQGSEKYTPVIQRADNVSELGDILQAATDSKDFITKAGKVNDSMVIEQNRAQQIESQRTTEQMNSFKDLKSMSNSMTEIKAQFESGFTWVIKEFPTFFAEVKVGMSEIKGLIVEMGGYVKSLLNSPLVRGISSGIGSLFK